MLALPLHRCYWDSQQNELLAGDLRQKLVALQLRRFDIYADALEMCMDNMRAANLEEMDQEEVRDAFPQMARLMLKLLREERLECKSLERPDKVGAAITADDLIAAQRERYSVRCKPVPKASSSWVPLAVR